MIDHYTKAELNFEDWCCATVDEYISLGGRGYVGGKTVSMIYDPPGLLVKFLQDEPRDCYEEGLDAREYAAQILSEYGKKLSDEEI